MRRLAVCVSLMLLAGAFGCRTPDNTPETKVTTKDGKVSAVFPHQPTESKDGDDVMYMYESRDGRTAFLLSPADLGEGIDFTDKALVKKTFDDSRDASIREIKGKLLSTKAIALGKYPGQTFDAEVPQGIYRSRMYFKEKGFVQIIVLGPRAFIEGAEAQKFLDSLKIAE